jgi:uncharacterized YccA/Bax inhibitor family protein
MNPNPALSRVSGLPEYGTVTMGGIINRTAMLVGFATIAFGAMWRGLQMGSISPMAGTICGLLGFVMALAIIFTRTANPLLISIYSLLEGAMLGGLSYLADLRYPGIAWQAALGTFGCFFSVLGLYRAGILRASPTFVKVICALILGIAATYLIDLVMGLFGSQMEILHGNSNASIGLSAIIVIVASLSFVIDFNRAEEAVQGGVSEQYSWRIAFGLLVGLVWLYIEILRLLLKVRSRK